MHSGGTGSRAANRKNRGVDASSRRKKSKNSALKKQLVYSCQVGSWASTDSTPPAHRPAPHPTPTLPAHRPRARPSGVAGPAPGRAAVLARPASASGQSGAHPPALSLLRRIGRGVGRARAQTPDSSPERRRGSASAPARLGHGGPGFYLTIVTIASSPARRPPTRAPSGSGQPQCALTLERLRRWLCAVVGPVLF